MSTEKRLNFDNFALSSDHFMEVLADLGLSFITNFIDSIKLQDRMR